MGFAFEAGRVLLDWDCVLGVSDLLGLNRTFVRYSYPCSLELRDYYWVVFLVDCLQLE